MPSLDLRIHRSTHAPSKVLGYRLDAVRVLAEVTLQTRNGWTGTWNGVVDTGAPASLFPRYAWQNADFKSIGAIRLGGTVHRPECRIPARLALVKCCLRGRRATLGPFEMHAFLAESDDAPILSGMSGLLDRIRLQLDIPARVARLEFDQLGESPS